MNLRTALIVDTETGGLNPLEDPCLEVAACLFDIAYATPLVTFSSLIQATTNNAHEINRIPPGVLLEADAPGLVWGNVAKMVDHADVLIAHEARFDRSFFPPTLRDKRPWICSKREIQFPRGKQGDSLVQLALAHGLWVSHAHRALSDVDTLCRIFERCRELGYFIDDMLRMALRPRKTVVSLAPFEQKEAVKAAGFEWVPSLRLWRKSVPLDQLENLPFRVREATPQESAA